MGKGNKGDLKRKREWVRGKGERRMKGIKEVGDLRRTRREVGGGRSRDEKGRGGVNLREI